MTGPDDLFDENLERLIRASALEPPDAPRARARFLSLAKDRLPFDARWARRIAMAAALVLAAGLLYSAFQPGVSRPLASPGVSPSVVQGPSGLPPARPPEVAPGTPTQEPAQAAPPGKPEAVPPAPVGKVTFGVTLPASRSPDSTMTVRGSSPYPDGTVLLLTGWRAREEYSGGRLVSVREQLSSAPCGVKGRRYESPLRWGGPGPYLVTAALSESQPPSVAEGLKGALSCSEAFEFAGWGDEVVPQLGPKLTQFDRFQKECLEAVGKIELLASNESTWVKERKNVDARGADLILTREAQQALEEARTLLVRLETSDVRSLYPAAWNELVSTLRSLRGCAQHLEYEGGRFVRARSYHTPTEPIKTHRGEPFGFGALRTYAGEAGSIAGREMSLWVVKELRRTEMRGTPDLERLLQTVGPHPGVALIAARLDRAGRPDLEALEKDLRSGP